jgi:hypothetical protein
MALYSEWDKVDKPNMRQFAGPTVKRLHASSGIRLICFILPPYTFWCVKVVVSIS